MKTKENWDLAQVYSAKEIIRAGLALIFLSLSGIL